MNAITIDFPSLNFIFECFAWCMIQVTLFTSASLLVYVLVRQQGSHRNVLLLVASLAIVGLMTLTCMSPWPHWDFVVESHWKEVQSQTPITIAESLPHVTIPDLGGTPGASSDGRGGHPDATPRPSLDLWNLGLKDVPPSEQFVADAARPWWQFAAGAAGLLAAVGIGRFLAGLAFVHRYRRQSIPIDDPRLLAEFYTLACKLQIAAPVELVEVPSLGVPATIGWRRPLVLLPANWREWSASERRAVFAHELSHVAQRHFPLWLVGQAAVATHFYHPLVHWLDRQLRLEQELAADRLAARVFGNRRHYATVLASLALGPSRPADVCAGLGLFMSRPLLMRRIAMLRESRTDERRPPRLIRSAALVLLVSTALVALGVRAAPPPVAVDESANASSTRRSGIETVNSTTALIQVSGEPTDVYVRTHIALLKSDQVVKTALAKAAVADLAILAQRTDRVQWVIDHLDVGSIADTNIVYVRMQGAGDDTAQLRMLVDAVVEAHIAEVQKTVTMDSQRHSIVRDRLAKSLHKLSEEIKTKLDEHNALAQELGVVDARQRDPEAELLMRDLSELQKSKGALEAQLGEVQTNYMVLENHLKNPKAIDAIVDEQLASDPNMKMMNSELMNLQHQLNAQSDNVEHRESESERVQQLINAKQQQISQYRAQLKSQMKKDEEGKPITALQRNRKIFQNRARVLQQQLAAISKTIQENREKLDARNQRSVELEVGSKELEQLQTIANEMSVKLEMLDVEYVAPPRVRVIQWAM